MHIFFDHTTWWYITWYHPASTHLESPSYTHVGAWHQLGPHTDKCIVSLCLSSTLDWCSIFPSVWLPDGSMVYHYNKFSVPPSHQAAALLQSDRSIYSQYWFFITCDIIPWKTHLDYKISLLYHLQETCQGSVLFTTHITIHMKWYSICINIIFCLVLDKSKFIYPQISQEFRKF